MFKNYKLLYIGYLLSILSFCLAFIKIISTGEGLNFFSICGMVFTDISLSLKSSIALSGWDK